MQAERTLHPRQCSMDPDDVIPKYPQAATNLHAHELIISCPRLSPKAFSIKGCWS